MIIGRLTISFDRGTATNQAEDIGLARAPTVTEDGGVVRGLGTHYRSERTRAEAAERTNEEARVRAAFKRTFVGSPIPGTYVLPTPGAGAQTLAALDPPVREDVQVRVSEYILEPTEALPPAEVAEWAARVSKQIQDVPLGRGKGQDWATTTEGGVQGIAILEGLAACPIIVDATRAAILDLIADAKLQRLDRIGIKRKLAQVIVEVEAAPVAPRRAPALKVGDGDEVQETINPRRRRRA